MEILGAFMSDPVCRTAPVTSGGISQTVDSNITLGNLLSGSTFTQTHIDKNNPAAQDLIFALKIYLMTGDAAELENVKTSLSQLNQSDPSTPVILKNLKKILSRDIALEALCDRIEKTLDLPQVKDAFVEDKVKSGDTKFIFRGLRLDSHFADRWWDEDFFQATTLVPPGILQPHSDLSLSLTAEASLTNPDLNFWLRATYEDFRTPSALDAQGVRWGVELGLVNYGALKRFDLGSNFQLGLMGNKRVGVGFGSSRYGSFENQDISGLESPAKSVAEMHFTNEADLITIGHRNFQLGLSFFNGRMRVPLSDGGDVNNCEGSFCKQSDFIKPNQMFPVRLSLIWYLNPPEEDRFAGLGPLRDAEIGFILFDLATSRLKSFYTFRGDAMFVNTLASFGEANPLGTVGTEKQYGTIQMGRHLLMTIDGFSMGGNAATLERVIRHGTPLELGLVSAEEGAWLLANIIGAATSEPYPSGFELYEEGKKGAITDFNGRAHLHMLPSLLTSQTLGVLGGLNLLGRPPEEVDWGSAYMISRYSLFAGGLILSLFSGSIATDSEPDGFLSGTLASNRHPFFDGTSGDYDLLGKEFIQKESWAGTTAHVGSVMMGFALTGILQQAFKPKPNVGTAYLDTDRGPTSIAETLEIDASLTPDGFFLGARGGF